MSNCGNIGHANRRLLSSVDSAVNQSSFRGAACAPRNFPRSSNKAAGDWPRQLILFSLDAMVSAVRSGWAAFHDIQLEFHFYSMKDLRLAINEVVHHDDVMLAVVIGPRGNIAGRNPDQRDAGFIELDAEEGQTSIARRRRNETAE
jgi:hypothetical protein